MVNFILKISADLENITNLQPQGGCDDPNFPYLFKLKCGRCGELTSKETCVTLNETCPLPIGKGTTNLIQKCKFCGRDGTVTMIPGRGQPWTMTMIQALCKFCGRDGTVTMTPVRGQPLTHETSETGKYAPLMLFECRGYEPVDFVFGGGWKAESLEGTKFEDIDLSAGEFAEYCEKGECPVMISNLRATFDVQK